MDMTYQIVVPVYAYLPHIEGNLESINDWEHLLLVDNSKDSWLKQFEGRGAKIIYHPENIGVARSWNLGIKEGKDYTFFVSSSVRFNKGFQEVIQNLGELIEDEAKGIQWGMYTQLGWHCNALSRMAIEKVGYFDENFYPAYVEDIDMCRRLYLAGIHCDSKGITLGGTVPAVTIDAQPIETATTIKRAGLQVHFNKLNEYYKAKWGAHKPDEVYDLPFGDKPLDYFPHRSISELRQAYNL